MSREWAPKKPRRLSSRQQTGRAILPYLGGFFIGILIWTGWIIVYINSVGHVDVNYAMFMMLIIILIVEIPVIVLMSYLMYRRRVVKMRPKSSYDMVNIDKYLLLVASYRNGDYEYETIKSEEDVIESYSKGKAIVFTATPSGEKAMIWIGVILMAIIMIIFTVIMLVTSTDVELRILFMSIGYSFAAVFGAIFFVPNTVKLIRMKRSFFILTTEGIVYRQKWGGIRAYSWKELGLSLYSVTTNMRTLIGSIPLFESAQFNVILPNQAELEFKPGEYSQKEFISVEKLREYINKMTEVSNSAKSAFLSKISKAKIGLIAISFRHYYDLGKLELEERENAYRKMKYQIEKRETEKTPERREKVEKDETLDESLLQSFLQNNSGKAFTSNSIFKRINELDIDEQMRSKITLGMIENALEKLVKHGKIAVEIRESQKFYHL
jgi:hypothetical protein